MSVVPPGFGKFPRLWAQQHPSRITVGRRCGLLCFQPNAPGRLLRPLRGSFHQPLPLFAFADRVLLPFPASITYHMFCSIGYDRRIVKSQAEVRNGSWVRRKIEVPLLTRTFVRVIVCIEQKFELGGVHNVWLDILFHFGGRVVSDGPAVPGGGRHRTACPADTSPGGSTVSASWRSWKS
jgi:hypothetical protein